MFSKNVTEEYVYHFTTREAALEKILYSGKIKLNLLENTNDPREYKDWGITVTGGSDNNLPVWKALHLVNHKRKTQTKVLCLTMDDLKQQRCGLMRRGFASARMWAQYGGQHTGVCLIFDKKGLEEEIRKTVSSTEDCYCGPVKYSDQNFGVEFNFNTMGETEEEVQSGVELYIRSNIPQLFFTKLLDWRDEIEYRTMVYDDGTKPIFVPIANCLKGIMLGSDFPSVYVPLVQQMGKDLGVKIGQISWHEGIPYAHDRG